MNKPKLTKTRIFLAFAISIIADLIQYPITAATFTGFLAAPGEFADFVIDCIVMGANTLLLGFHWVFLPSAFLELIPGLDLIPTWTGSVAFVVWRRRHEQAAPPIIQPAIEIDATPVPPKLSAPQPPRIAS